MKKYQKKARTKEISSNIKTKTAKKSSLKDNVKEGNQNSLKAYGTPINDLHQPHTKAREVHSWILRRFPSHTDNIENE
jgi:hypothetical protein